MTKNNSIINEIKELSAMQKIQNEIRDVVISKMQDRIIYLEKELKSSKNEVEVLKNNLVTILKKMLTEKKKAPQKIFSPPKFSPLQTSFTSPAPRAKLVIKEKNHYFSPQHPKLNISGYCPTDPQSTFSCSQRVFEKKMADYGNTLHRSIQNDTDYSQNSLYLNTLNNNNNTICDTDSNNVSIRKQNISNLSSLNYINNERKSGIQVNSSTRTPNSGSSTSSYISRGMKKKGSLTKLSYGSLTTRNKVQMKTINHNHSKVYSYLSPRMGLKTERYMTITNSGNKYNNKVNTKKKIMK